MRRVVITGMGVVSALGDTCDEMFQRILNKECAIQLIKHFDATNYRAMLAAPIYDFDFSMHFDEKEMRFNDRFTQFARVASKSAYLQSNLDNTPLNRDRFGVIFGSGIGGIASMEKAKENLDKRGANRVFPHFIPMSIVNSAAGMIAIDLQALGTCLPIVTGCAAGSDAIGEGYLKIKHNQLDVALAGASEASITPLGVAGFMAMRALHEGKDATYASIPFDSNRSGFVMGEGAGAIVLEEYEHAKKRKATILGEIVGYGSTCDAFHITAPQEDGTGIYKAMKMALEDAAIDHHSIGYINAHGTSTPFNDVIESKAIYDLFKEDAIVSSTKSHLGHCLGASGAIEAIITLEALKHQTIPATINTSVIDDKILATIALENITKEIAYAMSNSLGFGGHNASLLFKRWDDSET